MVKHSATCTIPIEKDQNILIEQSEIQIYRIVVVYTLTIKLWGIAIANLVYLVACTD